MTDSGWATVLRFEWAEYEHLQPRGDRGRLSKLSQRTATGSIRNQFHCFRRLNVGFLPRIAESNHQEHWLDSGLARTWTWHFLQNLTVQVQQESHRTQCLVRRVRCRSGETCRVESVLDLQGRLAEPEFDRGRLFVLCEDSHHRMRRSRHGRNADDLRQFRKQDRRFLPAQ